MRKKRDKPLITSQLMTLAEQRPITNKAALQHLESLKLLDGTLKADEAFLARLLAEMRKDGRIRDARDQKSAEKDFLKAAILAFCEEMHPVGVRQIAYAMHAQGFIEKKESAFAYCGKVTGQMREDGELPWEYIRDNSREYEPTWTSPPESTAAEIIATGTQRVDNIPHLVRHWIRNAFPSEFEILPDALDREKWHKQRNYVEVWIEKKGLLGVIEPITKAWEVSLVAAAGQCSKTILYEAAQHFDRISRSGRQPVVLYFGDYDPAGRAIWRSLEERVTRYCEETTPDFFYKGVTQEQIESYSLPTRPLDDSKKGTSGMKDFDDDRAVDLDAMPAEALRRLVDDSIMQLYSQDVADANTAEKNAEIQQIQDAYEDIRSDNLELIEQLNQISNEVFDRLLQK